MPQELKSVMGIAAFGMKAQGIRLKVIAQNVANAASTAEKTGGDPYRRQIVAFGSELDKALKAQVVTIKDIQTDESEFNSVYDPEHPAADENGFVLMPNVNALVEMMDMREAQRSYEANLNVLDTAKSMMSRTLDMLR